MRGSTVSYILALLNLGLAGMNFGFYASSHRWFSLFCAIVNILGAVICGALAQMTRRNEKEIERINRDMDRMIG